MTRFSHPGPLRPARLLEVVYGVLGVSLIAWSVLKLERAQFQDTLLLLALVGVLSPFFIHLRMGVRLPASTPVELATLLIGTPAQAILIAATVGLCASVAYRRPVWRVLYNIGNLAGPAGLSAVVLAVLLDPWPQPMSVPWHLPAMAVALAIRYFFNQLGLVLLICAEKGGPIWGTLVNLVAAEGWASLSIRLTPVLMAMAYPTGGLWVMILGGLAQVAVGGAIRAQAVKAGLEQQALTDSLTGIGNRHAWHEYRLTYKPGSVELVAAVDVDGLKGVNDAFGHDQGDAVLADLARRLKNVAGCKVFRIGGDEFVVGLADERAGGPAQTALVAAVDEFGRAWQEQGYRVAASVGFAGCPDEALDPAAAYTLADQRMYLVKGRVTRRAVQ